MKIVTAVVQPFKLDEVKDALKAVGVQGLTVSEVRGFGRQRGHTEVYRGAEYQIDFRPKLKVEVLVSDELTARVIEAVMHVARTGQIGDGKIWVTHVEEAYRIRTGETGSDAL